MFACVVPIYIVYIRAKLLSQEPRCFFDTSLVLKLSVIYLPRRNKLAVMGLPINLAKIDFGLCNRIY